MNRWISRRIIFLVLTGTMTAVAIFLLFGCSERGEDKTPATVSGAVTVPLSEARIYIYGEGEDIFAPFPGPSTWEIHRCREEKGVGRERRACEDRRLQEPTALLRGEARYSVDPELLRRGQDCQ